MKEKLTSDFIKHKADLNDLYSDLHQNPELSFQEKKTSEKLIKIIRSLGFDANEKIGGYGFAGILTNGDGPVIMLRTDMDALPVKELTNLDYKSEKTATDMFGNTVSVMHACGHDLHMTVFIGALKLLAENKNKWNGTLIALGQPAEEVGKGAKAMIEDGLFDVVPTPDYLLAYHDFPELKSGQIGFTKGVSWAGCDTLDLKVYGEGGHGAMPETAKDPIVLASQIVLALQTIVSRGVSAFDKVVLTIGAINGGTKHNIIPEEVELKISLRTFSDETRKKVIESIKRIAENTARAFGIKEKKLPLLQGLENYHPPVVNDPQVARAFSDSAETIVGKQNVIEVPPVSVSEDIEMFRRAEPEIKSAIFWLGIDNIEHIKLPEDLKGQTPPLHSPYFAPDAELPIKTGAVVMAKALIDLFNNGVTD